MLVNMIILLITTSLMYEAERRILWAFEMDKNALKLSILRLATLILFLVIMKAVNLGFTLTLAFVWIISARLISIPTYLQRWNFTKRAKTRPVSIFIKAYWKFSKWIFFRDFLSYLAGNIYVPMVFFMLGAAKTGGFEVGRQLIAPFYIIPMGLNSYLLPKLTKDKGKMSNKQYEHYVLKLMVAWISLFATASILLISFGN